MVLANYVFFMRGAAIRESRHLFFYTSFSFPGCCDFHEMTHRKSITTTGYSRVCMGEMTEQLFRSHLALDDPRRVL
jgi:hypothetical protein